MSAPALLGCPHCNRPISFVPEMAGKFVGCPHCRKQLQMPATSPTPAVPNRPASRPQLSPSTAPTEPGPPSRIDFDMHFTTDAEPPPDRRADDRSRVEPIWFRRTETFATASMWLGIAATVAVAALIIHFSLVPLFRAGDGRSVAAGALALLGLLLFSAMAIVGFVALRAGLFVLVDMGRNLRALRQAQQPGK